MNISDVRQCAPSETAMPPPSLFFGSGYGVGWASYCLNVQWNGNWTSWMDQAMVAGTAAFHSNIKSSILDELKSATVGHMGGMESTQHSIESNRHLNHVRQNDNNSLR